ncbi:MAG: sulfatase/phosphatase domain-containing protein [Ferruginibacter sp.]
MVLGNLCRQGDRKALYYHYYKSSEHSVSPHFGIKTKTYKLIRFYKKVN